MSSRSLAIEIGADDVEATLRTGHGSWRGAGLPAAWWAPDRTLPSILGCNKRGPHGDLRFCQSLRPRKQLIHPLGAHVIAHSAIAAA